MRWATATTSFPSPARRSRARRSPRRSVGADPRRRAPCPVTRAVASSVRSATSVRIRSSERFVSASIWRFVSSSRRARSASASSFTRSICASATFRASARMSAASPFASAISWRCCSRRPRASSRALSASSTAARIRSRRSSIVFWIGPNANCLSTKNVSAKQISVQIISPGTTSISPPVDSSSAAWARNRCIAQTRTYARRPPMRP